MYGTAESSLRLLIEGVTVIPITPEIALLAAQFPGDYPGDPGDRLIVRDRPCRRHDAGHSG
jgi:PIN domain nuclease of toxin-antitoxin system